jgi:hypothetical protein
MSLLLPATGQMVEEPKNEPRIPSVAGVTTVYYHNSHADMFLSRLLQGYALNGAPPFPQLKLASLHIDQFPSNDKGRELATRHGIPLHGTIEQALTLGTGKLAVDGIFLVAEHGNYPESDTGQILFPKRRMFDEIARLVRAANKSVPIFIDKHFADNWQDAKAIYDQALQARIPLMAGSSLPVLWREPARDVERDRPLREIVALSYHRLDAYGFHALEVVQCLAERRPQGESGVRRVRTLQGPAVWQAIDAGVIDRELLDAALRCAKDRPIPTNRPLREQVPQPALFIVEYLDGLRASVLSLDQLYIDWAAAWRYTDHRHEAAVFWTQEARPFMHFTHLLRQIEPFMQSGSAPWPVERTLLTTGMLDALLISRRDQGRWVDTPHLKIAYNSTYQWTQPPPPPPDRPIDSQ